MELNTIATNEWLISDNPEDMAQINNPEYSMACWKRNLTAVDSCIATILSANLNRLDARCSYKEASEVLKQHLIKAINIEQTSGIDALLSDVQYLAKMFFDISGSEQIRLYFAVVESDMCRRFHTDLSDLRMLCSYYGPGTVCLKSNDISENLLDKAVVEPNIISEEDLYHIDTQDVVIMKGALHANSNGTGVLHRSPVLSESNKKRVIIRLDSSSFPF